MSVKINPEEFDKAPNADSKQTEIPLQTAERVSAEHVADAMAEGFPEMSDMEFGTPGAATSTPSANDAPRDSSGQPFDASRHKMDKDGKPILNDEGKFKRRYSKRSPDKGDEDEYDATAKMLSAGIFKFFGMLFDPVEAKPDPEFAETITDAYASALRAKGLSITDPTWNAVGLTGIYAFGVVQQPKSREKAMTYWSAIKKKFSKGGNTLGEAVDMGPGH